VFSLFSLSQRITFRVLFLTRARFVMDAILEQFGKRQAARALLTPEPEAPDAQTLKLMEDARKVQEVRKQEMLAYKERVGGHLRRLMQNDELGFMRYPPSEAEYRYVIAQEAESCGLVAHEFGEEGIDRFVIVYKPEFEPDDEEVARMSLKYNEKMDAAAIEKMLKADTGQQPEQEKKPRKKKEVEEENVVLHAVGTVKRVRRGTADAIEEIRRQKTKQKTDAIDDLFNKAEEIPVNPDN
jgi:hypothetical protein